MSPLRTEEEIRQRVSAIKAKLAQIDSAMDKEKASPFFKRRRSMFNFLGGERRIYRALLREWRSICDE